MKIIENLGDAHHVPNQHFVTYRMNVSEDRTPVLVEAVEAAARVIPDREELPPTMRGGRRIPLGKSQKLPGGGM